MGRRQSRQPCAVAGCPELSDETYCPKHKPEAYAGRRGWDGYGSDYAALKRQVLREEPVCYRCAERASQTADHVIPRSQGGATVRSNLRGICNPCHRSKSQREAAHARTPGV